MASAGGVIRVGSPSDAESLPLKLKIEDDGSTIKIQKPETYSKPWNLSKKDLQSILGSYFASTSMPNAQSCYDYICNDRKAKLVATEFAFTRIVAEEDT